MSRGWSVAIGDRNSMIKVMAGDEQIASVRGLQVVAVPRAKLLAAAPEMLEALKAWVGMFAPIERPDTEGAEWLTKSRDIIAKAEGRG